MSGPEFFARLGLFVREHFFDVKTCRRLCHEIQCAYNETALVVTGSQTSVDLDMRRTINARLPDKTVNSVKKYLLEIKPAVEGHYKVKLTGLQTPQFLIHRQGDYFRAHQDGGTDPQEPEFIRQRRLTAVVFLNSQSEDGGSDSYCGGALELYGLIDDPRCATYGFPLRGEQGLLVVFPSDTLHEVSPVTHGDRLSIVSWFF